jgi:hypothetical protein
VGIHGFWHSREKVVMREVLVETPWLQAGCCGGHGQERGSATLLDLAAASMRLASHRIRCSFVI